MNKKQAMITGGAILAKVLPNVTRACEIGITTLEIDALATKLIKQYGGELSFTRVPGYNWATCLSVNEVIVHGVPSSRKLVSGDVLKLDIGVYYEGYHVDYGDTFVIGKADDKTSAFLKKGADTLAEALKLVKTGEYIGAVSKGYFRSHQRSGIKLIYELTGHTVGHELHEEPLIPGYLEKPIKKTPQFKAGSAYAVEIIYALDDHFIEYCHDDGWSLCTTTRNLNGCFENSVYVDNDETVVLV